MLKINYSKRQKFHLLAKINDVLIGVIFSTKERAYLFYPNCRLTEQAHGVIDFNTNYTF